MADFNEEMKNLVQMERQAYQDDQTSLDEALDQMKKTVEGKNKVLKNKLVMALGYIQPNLCGNAESVKLEEVIKIACDILESSGKSSFLKGPSSKPPGLPINLGNTANNSSLLSYQT